MRKARLETIDFLHHPTAIDKYFKKVFIFTKFFGQPTLYKTNLLDIDPKLKELRLNLLEEEFNELIKARSERNVVEVVDALADSLYVAYGMCVTYGYAKRYVPPHKLEEKNYFDKIIDYFEYIKYYHTVEPSDEKVRSYLSKYIDAIFHYCYFALIPIQECFDEVHRSNMSKIAPTLEIAEESVKKLSPVKCTIKENEGVFLIIRDKDGKILKPINYSKPELKKIINTEKIIVNYFEENFRRRIKRKWEKEIDEKIAEILNKKGQKHDLYENFYAQEMAQRQRVLMRKRKK